MPSARKKNLLKFNARGITSAANQPSFDLDPLCDRDPSRVGHTGRDGLRPRNHSATIVDQFAPTGAVADANETSGLQITDRDWRFIFASRREAELDVLLFSPLFSPPTSAVAQELVGFRSANFLPLPSSPVTARVERLIAKGAAMNDDLLTGGDIWRTQYKLNKNGQVIPLTPAESLIQQNFVRMDANVRAATQVNGLDRMVAGAILHNTPKTNVGADGLITTPIVPTSSFGDVTAPHSPPPAPFAPTRSEFRPPSGGPKPVTEAKNDRRFELSA